MVLFRPGWLGRPGWISVDLGKGACGLAGFGPMPRWSWPCGFDPWPLRQLGCLRAPLAVSFLV